VKRDTFSKSGEAKTHFSNEKKTVLRSSAMKKHLFFVRLRHQRNTHGEKESDVTQTARITSGPLENCRLQFFLQTSSFHAREIVFAPSSLQAAYTHLRTVRAPHDDNFLSARSTRFGSRRLSKHSAREAEKRCLGEYQASASLHHLSFSLHLCALACSFPCVLI